MQRYHSTDDKRMRLNGSFVIYQDKVYSCHVTGDERAEEVVIRCDRTDSTQVVRYTQDAFQPALFRLGFTNMRNRGAVALSSTGVRSQKAGFSNRLYTTPHQNSPVTSSMLDYIYNNKYPMFVDAARRARDSGRTTLAFSRQFAITHDHKIVDTQFTTVGVYNSELREIKMTMPKDSDPVTVEFTQKMLKEDVNDDRIDFI